MIEASRALNRSPRAHIVVILPRGEAIRNFVYTDVLEEVAQDAEISVLSVVPSEDFRIMLSERYRNVFALNEFSERWLVRELRELLDMAHGRWLWSEAAKERWRLRNIEATTPLEKLKRTSKKLASYPFANRRGLRVLDRLQRTTSKFRRTTNEYVRLFQEIRPTLVFNGSHVHSKVALQAVQAAQSLSIPTAAFIFSWDNLTSQGRIMPLYDNYFVWNAAIRDQLLRIYDTIRPEQVFVTGTPQFDFHYRQEIYWSREEFCARVGADPLRPIVLYSTGMPNHMPGEPAIVRAIAEMLREMSDLGPPQLLVRVYPKDRSSRFDELKRSSPDILFPEVPWEPTWQTPRIEDTPLLTNTLRHAALGINVASTISLELCLFDKPVINVGYNPPGVATSEVDYSRYYEFDHYRPLVASEAVVVAKSQNNMPSLIRSALMDPGANSFHRRTLVQKMFGKTLDGKSGMRVATQLLNLAGLQNV